MDAAQTEALIFEVWGDSGSDLFVCVCECVGGACVLGERLLGECLHTHPHFFEPRTGRRGPGAVRQSHGPRSQLPAPSNTITHICVNHAQAGEALVLYGKVMDRVSNVGAVCSALASRDHLLEKASLLMAKVFLTYRVRRDRMGGGGRGGSLLMA